MKLFVWEGEGVLTDYTDGMIVAMAQNLERALAAIEKKCSYAKAFPPNPTQVIDLGNATEHEEAWVCWGGG